MPDRKPNRDVEESFGYASLESGKMGLEIEIWKLSAYRWYLNY